MSSGTPTKALAPLLMAALACALNGCGPAESDWKIASGADLGSVPGVQLEPSGRPTTLPTTFPATYATPTQAVAEMPISLAEVRSWALQNNLDLQVALYSPRIASERISEEEARFESTFFLDASAGISDPPSRFGNGSQTTSVGVTPGIRIPLRTGGTLEFAGPLDYLDTDASGSAFDDSYYRTAGRATLSHPLLRNAGRDTAEYAIRFSGYEHEISRARTRLEVTRVLAAVDRVYWRLYAARQQLVVRKQQYDLAYALLERTERELRVGKTTQVELVRAQSGVADRVDAIITAENIVRERQRELKRLLNHPEMDERTLLVPATSPDATHYEVDPTSLVNAAIANRSEMLEQELRLAQDALNIRYARNQRLPLLSAAYTYRVNGLGDVPADAYDMTFRRDYEDHSLGLRLEVPIGNELARSRLRRAQLERLQQLSSRSAQTLAIRKEVLDAVDQLEAAWQRIIANRARTVLASRTLEAEQRQAEAGIRTNTEVLDALTRLADAQSSEIAALTDYQIAQIDLAYATGTLLGFARVDWQRPAEEGP